MLSSVDGSNIKTGKRENFETVRTFHEKVQHGSGDIKNLPSKMEAPPPLRTKD